MAKHIRLIVGEAKRMAEASGVTCRFDERKPASGHQYLIFERGGRRMRKPLSTSPRDPDNACRLALAEIRKIVKELSC